jgi:hypothetical protein
MNDFLTSDAFVFGPLFAELSDVLEAEKIEGARRAAEYDRFEAAIIADLTPAALARFAKLKARTHSRIVEFSDGVLTVEAGNKVGTIDAAGSLKVAS